MPRKYSFAKLVHELDVSAKFRLGITAIIVERVTNTSVVLQHD